MPTSKRLFQSPVAVFQQLQNGERDMRTVPEWIGKTDNSRVPASVKQRVIEAQDNRCALNPDHEFRPGDKIEFDHKTPLWLHGEHRESNLQAVLSEAHARKTAAEAPIRAKINRVKQKHLGLRPEKPKSPYKRKVCGSVVDRATGEPVR